MNPDMEALLKKMQAGETIQKKWLGQYAVYAALTISYEGLLIQRENLELQKKIEAHLATLSATVVEKNDYRAKAPAGAPLTPDKVKAIRTSI